MSLYGRIMLVSVASVMLSGQVLLACAGCGCSAPKAKPEPPAAEHVEKADIGTSVLAALIDSGVSVTILDARTGKFDDGRRVPGAVAMSPSVKAKDAAKVIPSKDSLVVTYCTSLKCGASAALAEKLVSLGYKNILEYPEGIDGWEKGGQKVVKAK